MMSAGRVSEEMLGKATFGCIFRRNMELRIVLLFW